MLNYKVEVETSSKAIRYISADNPDEIIAWIEEGVNPNGLVVESERRQETVNKVIRIFEVHEKEITL